MSLGHRRWGSGRERGKGGGKGERETVVYDTGGEWYSRLGLPEMSASVLPVTQLVPCY